MRPSPWPSRRRTPLTGRADDMATIADQLTAERRGSGRAAMRRRANFADLSRAGDRPHRGLLHHPGADRHRRVLHRPQPVAAGDQFTTEQYQRVFSGDNRLTPVIGMTFIYVFGTLAIFNVTFAADPGAGDDLDQQCLRRLLPRRVAAAEDEPLGALHPALAVGGRSVGGRTAQPDPDDRLRPQLAARPQDPGAGHADHRRQRLHRRLARHDHLHLGDPRDSRAPLPCRAGRWRRHACR